MVYMRVLVFSEDDREDERRTTKDGEGINEDPFCISYSLLVRVHSRRACMHAARKGICMLHASPRFICRAYCVGTIGV